MEMGTLEDETFPAQHTSFGLKILVDPQQQASPIDIVAIHGIGAEPSKMWIGKQEVLQDGKATFVETNWLTDATMLPELAPNARIMRYGYKSQWFGTEEVETKKTYVYDVANALLTGLTELRSNDASTSRPLIFIAHSFGGIVLIKALRLAFDDTTSQSIPSRRTADPVMAGNSAIFWSTAGLVFFGTPFRGRAGHNLEAWIDRLFYCHTTKHEKLSEAPPPIKIWGETMSTSVPGNPYLQDMVRKFGETRLEDHPIPLCCFYEKLPSPVGKLVGDPSWGNYELVPYESACLDVSKNVSSHGLERHHYNLPKFPDAHDEAWKTVRTKIGPMITGARQFLVENQKDQDFCVEFNELDLPVARSFRGRQMELQNMRDILQQSDGRQAVILHGLGGIGKTQLAVEYLRQYKADYSAIFWLSSQDQASLRRDFSLVARRIRREHPFAGYGLSEAANNESLNDDSPVDAVKEWLDHPKNKRWMLVLDNCNKPEQADEAERGSVNIKKYLPTSNHGSVIITTTASNLNLWDWHQIKIDKLKDIKDGLQILADASGRSCTLQDPDAIKLAKQLDGLPLALASAGYYLQQVTTSFKTYLELWGESWLQLQQTSPTLSPYNRTLYSTWQLSLDNIAEHNDLAPKLLSLWAYFDKDNLSLEMLQEGRDEGPCWFNNLVTELNFNAAIRELCDHALVAATDTGYSMHSCVHSWTVHVVNREWDIDIALLATVCTKSYWLRQARVISVVTTDSHYTDAQFLGEQLDHNGNPPVDLLKHMVASEQARVQYSAQVEVLTHQTIPPKALRWYRDSLRRINERAANSLPSLKLQTGVIDGNMVRMEIEKMLDKPRELVSQMHVNFTPHSSQAHEWNSLGKELLATSNWEKKLDRLANEAV